MMASCWPQACLSDWLSYPWTVWLATLSVGLGAAVLPALPLVLVVWLTRGRA